MRKRIVGWLVLVPLCLLVLIFALANRHMVAVNFNPLVAVDETAPGFGMPLFLVIYAVLFAGISLGGLAVWFTQAGHRREERRLRRENEKLKTDLDHARRAPARADDPALLAADELA
ncbi:lipopolysaccharide assembly protein LapA domain-containing protein [Pelagibacterium sp. 26DY04]|uniref:lipopolysaccharide assembly protein LapA domain-containing protein n=1 Tax=unclassified Pelagibacterium TaxID=2623280 RepID=UPI002815BCAB|nr:MULTISPECIES: lipopolysaccharide assembly protein LapA domain-containing protein [unclassified Pelagibacterium]WMT87270.1 lipopolysaccharide assembly protein LapA domain-containing protein [Pelagibacterium sp. 26DY04]WMT92033.1 lipopolysaccharide assembly protein LapA domain-containing protein [Pelagibacterium sp. H642]